jgi:hypothetical protein
MKNLGRTGLGVTALVAAAALAACMGETRRPSDRPTLTSSTDGPAAERPALDEEALRQFGFVLYWDSLVRDEKLSALTIEGDFEQGFGKPQLYAYSESNRLYQIDLHSGMVNWLFDVGRPLAFPQGRWISEWCYKPELPQGEGGPTYKRYDEVYFVARDTLVALDKDNGSELWSVRLPFGVSSPPQANESHVFVGAWDDRIYAFRKDKPDIADWNWRTEGDILTRPAVDGASVFVASGDGGLHTFDTGGGGPKWTFDTEKRLTLDPLVFNKLLYVAGEDYNLYVLNVIDGLLEYRHGAGQPITERPVAIDNGQGDRAVYFTAGTEGVHALARGIRPKPTEGNPRKTIHELLWQRPSASRVLCRGSQDVYLLEPGSDSDHVKIVRVGAKDGKEKGSMELAGVDWILTNPAGPNNPIREQSLLGGIIVVGHRNGWIFALKEIATLPGGIEPGAE